MAIIPITKDHIDQVTLEMHPERTFSSSSASGITGSVYVYANRSPFFRQRIESSPFSSYSNDSETYEGIEGAYDATSYETCLDELIAQNNDSDGGADTDRSWAYENYLTHAHSQKQSPELSKYMEIWRFKPSFSFTSNTLRKNVIKDVLFKFYGGNYPQLDWAYTNYSCLTFFTASQITPNSALVYPAPATGLTYNQYVNTSSFTISFWLNPRRTTTNDQADYRAGTILHSSSSFAVSLVSGSATDDAGNPTAFRILLQLSQSADLAPSLVDLSLTNNQRSFPDDLTFLSKDNALRLNNWHNVTISWSADHNYGTGSMWIDAEENSRIDFLVASSAINTSHITRFTPLIVGNFYDGHNTGGTPAMTKFFNATVASTEGVEDHGAAAGEEIDPSKMTHKPNADVHELKIYNRYLTTDERATGSFAGPPSLEDLIFYVPPFFTKESLNRNVLTTPYFTKKTATEEPFNVDLSFGVGGHDLNIENFTRDFATGIYPRNYCLTASVVTSDVLWQTANEIMWNRGPHVDYFRARQLLLLPCDNGRFMPNFELLASGTVTSPITSGSAVDKFVDDAGYLDYSLITLRDMVSTGSSSELSIETAPGEEESDIAEELHGGAWETQKDDPATAYELTVVQRTKDGSSNEVYFFDASNLFYGNRIIPGTFMITDSALTGSAGAVGIKIRDDGQGNLYRADCLSLHAKWNSVGNILYDEGIAVIKSPNIPLIGQDQFEISFKGLHNVHTYEVNIMLSPNLFTSSSNPTFVGGRGDEYANSADPNYVAFNSILLHDDNLNIITRSNLARPVLKKLGDKYMIRIKIDY
jgi:hypothetical protein